MNNAELINYLANIVKVIRADGVLSPREEAVYLDICKELKAHKKDIRGADKLAIDETYTVLPVGQFSDKVRNLEDLILVSLADGNIDIKEKSLIVQFAKQIGITQEQISLILKECKVKMEKSSISSICSKCNVSIPPGAKFCPGCGAAVGGQEATKQLEFNYPHEGVAIEFAESTSANFEMAIKIASSAPDFQKCLRSKKQWYLATWAKAQFMNAVELAENLKGIRNRKVYIDGKMTEWNEVFGFIWCLRNREEAYKPSMYCFGKDENQLNLWGCNQIRMAWNGWAEWWSYGKFEAKNIFVFDKERIRHNLKTNLQHVRFCPYIRRDLIEAVFELIPNNVKVDNRLGWKYKEDYERGPNSIKVTIKEKEDGYTHTNEFYADGVQPVGYDIAKEILQKAFKKCSIQDVSIKDLLK